MKKTLKILMIAASVFCMSVSAYAYDIVNLPKSMTASDALGIFDVSDIKRTTISEPVNNTYIEMSREEIEEFFNITEDMELTREINATPFRGTAVNLYTEDGSVSSFYLTSGVQIGMYGGITYMCYKPSEEDMQELMYIDSLLKDEEKKIRGEEIHVKTDTDFLKMPQDKWAQTTIEDAADHCLVPYEFVNKYKNDITREEFCILLGNAIKVAGNYASLDNYMSAKGVSYQTDYFSDCAGRDSSINMLHALGIVSGKEDGIFDPNGIITREEAAALVCRTAGLFQYIETDETLIYDDKENISPWARYFVAWVTNNFIMNGTDGSFLPQQTYTVQEAITTVNRMYKVMIR